MDEADYRYPTADVKHLDRWEAQSADGPRAPGPWYGIFGGVGVGSAVVAEAESALGRDLVF